MNTSELPAAITFFLALASAGASTWFARVFTKKLEVSGQSVGKPWRWWVHALAFIAFVNILMLFHYLTFGPFLPALLGVPIARTFSRTSWPSELHRSARLSVGALSTAWLAIGVYELTLGSWKETVVGAPIRVDLVYLFGPLLYFSSLRVYRAYSSTRNSNTSG